ncbi:MAG: type II toxin-antitoxin system RatA family toxin [Alphaproteobacteria bacterium]
MPVFEDKRAVPYALADMAGLVADVAHYPDFVPWLTALRIKRKLKVKGNEVLYCDVQAGFRTFREQFSCRVIKQSDLSAVTVEYVSGPMSHLDNRWTFNTLADGQTEVGFFIEFDFKNAVYRKAVGQVFEKASLKVLDAFGRRARSQFEPLPGFVHPVLPGDELDLTIV